jgi:hypothetical protein
MLHLRKLLHSGADGDEASAQASNEMLEDVMIGRLVGDGSRRALLLSLPQPFLHPLKQTLLFDIHVWIHTISLNLSR